MNPGEMCNTELIDLLRSLRGRRVRFFANRGNAGDGVIAAATYQLFRKHRIDFEPIEFGAALDGEVLALGGGGNLVPLYNMIRKTLLAYANRAEMMILMPHTIRGHEDLLASLGDHVHVFCRDAVSYVHVLDHAPRAHVYLGHDVALHLDAAAIRNSPHVAEWEAVYLQRTGSRHYGPTPVFGRNDPERKVALPPGTDISSLYLFGEQPGQAELSTYCLMRAIENAALVTTDRLHVAILAGLMGKETRLHDNSYGKNRAVYLHSIRRFLPSVTFVDTAATRSAA